MSKAECYEQSVRAENNEGKRLLARGNSTSTSSDIKFNANFDFDSDFASTNGHFAFTSSCYSSDLLDSG